MLVAQLTHSLPLGSCGQLVTHLVLNNYSPLPYGSTDNPDVCCYRAPAASQYGLHPQYHRAPSLMVGFGQWGIPADMCKLVKARVDSMFLTSVNFLVTSYTLPLTPSSLPFSFPCCSFPVPFPILSGSGILATSDSSP